MGQPYSGPVNIYNNCCPAPGTTPPDIAPYVVRIFGLQGIVGMRGNGSFVITTEGNDIVFGFTADAGLGSVTSVGLSSSTLTVGGTPVTTNGTLTVELTGATASIQGLTTAADKMIYTTASNVYAVTDLTSFARTILDDANAGAVRTTLGLVIGTNVQAFSQDLSDFVTNATWSGVDLSLAGSLTVSGTGSFNDISLVGGAVLGGVLDMGSRSIINADSGTFAGTVDASSFTGDGTGISNLDGSQITGGTVAVARGGTGLTSYAVGDLVYASGATTLAKLPDVAAGSFLRSGGVATAPAWSSITLPNSLAIGDLLYASTTGIVSRLADVVTGNALISGGVATAPAWGKITMAHTTGIAASGANNDITSFGNDISFQGVLLGSFLQDGIGSNGTSGQLLTSTGADSTRWSNQISLDTLYLATEFSLEGTLTGAGTTGAVTINKPSGTCRFAIGATSLVVTNNLCTTSNRVLATVCTNDATAYVKNVVTTTGAFTITLGAAATAETECFFALVLVG